MNTNIDINKLKKDMMELWEETFHDSTRYIKLVFDTYFCLDNAFYMYDGEKLIAALLGVEYEFQYRTEIGETSIFKGLYLCGLATHPDYRRRGIMARLMHQAETSAKERDFNITFLIPADSHLRDYYQKKGYHTASYKRCQALKKSGFEGKCNLYIYTFKSLLNRGKSLFVEEVAKWCCNKEKLRGESTTILHSTQDMMAIIYENENSFFVTECSFDPEYPILAEVMAVVFPTPSEDENKILSIIGLYLREEGYLQSSRDPIISLPADIKLAIIKHFHGYDIELNLPYTGTDQIEKVPYAMIKPVKDNDNSQKSDIKMYDISLMLD